MKTRFNLSVHALRWLAIVMPVAFWVVVLLAQFFLFPVGLTWQTAIFELITVALGATLFSYWIFQIVQEREQEVERRSEQLRSLHDAAITLTTELELTTVLQKVVDLSKGLMGAQYGALGVLDENGRRIEQFITSGLTEEERERLGPLPQGHGLLGALITEGTTIRIPKIDDDPRSVGFPPGHPPMRSLLGVPIRFKGRVVGDLYVTDKLAPDGSTTVFTAQDEQVLEMFATQAAIAIENAQLYRQRQQLVVLQERERIGMDLHDGIIQSIYAIGLQLEDAQTRIQPEPEEATLRVHRAILGLNEVIRDIRNYILDLRPQRFQGRDLKRGLEELVRDFRANTFLNVSLTADTLEPNLLTPEQTVEILHLAQEALTNVRKHARATNVQLDLIRDADAVVLTLEDDGTGFDIAGTSGSGNGLPNMRERAKAARGELSIRPGDESGTLVTLRVPVKRAA